MLDAGKRSASAQIGANSFKMFRAAGLLRRCATASPAWRTAKVNSFLEGSNSSTSNHRQAFLAVPALRDMPEAQPTASYRAPFRRFASSDRYATLSIGEIHSLLDAAAVDYRDCFERSELVERLQSAEALLPPHVKSQLDYMLQREGAPSTGAASPSALATSALFLDEQYVVSMFQAAKPAVVHVTTTREAAGIFGMNPMQIPQGSGSGFLWDAKGHVVTNWHVVQGARTAKITLYNNQSFDAELVGSEPDKDLAVLRIVRPATTVKFVPISVGSSSGLQVGQRVFAIGFPFALDQSLTAGIVSGLGREMQAVTGRTIRDVVQTDAAINPGNSGGPLLDSRGRLIGVNTMIYSRSGANHGIGFCIPSDTVRRVVNQIIRYGRVIRPGLGISCMPDGIITNVLGPGARGVIVREVSPGSGADHAGLRGLTRDASGNVILGDIIVSVGSQAIVRVEDLVAAVEQFNVGDQVPLGVRRGNQTVNIVVPLLKELSKA